MFKQVGSSDPARLVECCARLSSGVMEDVLYGSVWGFISLPLTTDVVVRLCTAACRWNVETNIRCSATLSSACLELEQFEKSWRYDPNGKREVRTVEAAESERGLYP